MIINRVFLYLFNKLMEVKNIKYLWKHVYNNLQIGLRTTSLIL